MRGIIEFQFLCFCILLLTQTSIQGQDLEAVDTIFHNWKGGPGGVACIVQDGKVIYRKAFGLANIKKAIPNSPELRYELASNAKQFTGMCIALLEEQHKLSLDDELKKYYPQLRIPHAIKIRNLLDHTSGLRDASVLAILSGKMNLKGEVRKKFNTKKYYLECLMRETDLNYDVGSELAYNNFNYVLLGDVVEKVSGQSLQAFSDSAIFKPLQMANTRWRDEVGLKIDREANGYLYTGRKFKKRKALGGIVGDHNLVTTIDDLARYEINFHNNRLGKGDASLIQKITTSSKLNNGKVTQYGFGLWTNTYYDVEHVAHGGDDGRHTSGIVRFPEHKLSIIILANSSRFRDTEMKAYAIADILLKDHLKKQNKVKENFNFIQLEQSQLSAKAGLYTMIDERGLGRLAKITYDNGELYASRNYYWKGLKLMALSPTDFVAYNPDGELVRVGFENENGIEYVTEIFREQPKVKYARHSEVGTTALEDYKGKYENASTGASIKVKIRGDKLSARKGILKIPLIAFDEDIFYAPANDALFIFQRDDNGRISSFKANAPDFRNFIFNKE